MQLPEELIAIVARHYYQTRERLLAFLKMSLICKTFRRELDAVSLDKEKRWAFLTRLSQKNTVYFGETMDFNYMIEKQLILAFEISYRLRATIVRHIQQYINKIGIDLFYAPGLLPLSCRSDHFAQSVVGPIDGKYNCHELLIEAEIRRRDKTFFDESLSFNIGGPPPILLKALSNVNHYLTFILHAKLIFCPDNSNTYITSPYEKLDYHYGCMLIPSNTTLYKTTFIGGKLFQ